MWLRGGGDGRTQATALPTVPSWGFSGLAWYSFRDAQISCQEELIVTSTLCSYEHPSEPLASLLLPAVPWQVQVLLYFLQLEAIPAPDSKRQSILFSTEV